MVCNKALDRLLEIIYTNNLTVSMCRVYQRNHGNLVKDTFETKTRKSEDKCYELSRFNSENDFGYLPGKKTHLTAFYFQNFF